MRSIKNKTLKRIVGMCIVLIVGFIASVSVHAAQVDVFSNYVRITDIELVYYAGSTYYADEVFDLTYESRIPYDAEVTRITLSGNMASNNGSNFAGINKGVYSFDTRKSYFTQQSLDTVLNLDSNMAVRQSWAVLFAVGYPMNASYITWQPEIRIYFE